MPNTHPTEKDRVQLHAQFTAAAEALTLEGKAPSSRALAGKTGLTQTAANNWLKGQRAASGVLSPKAEAQRQKIKEKHLVNRSESQRGKPEGITDRIAAPVRRAHGDQRQNYADFDAAGTGVGGAGSRQGDHRELHRGAGFAGGTDEYPDRGDDQAARRDDRGSARDSGKPGLGDALLGGAAKFVKKTKENLAERKEQQKVSDKPKSAGRPLSEKEAEELRETYSLALSSIFNFMDDGIQFTTGGHQEPDIWSSIDDDDLKIIVDARLKAATLSAKDAAKVKRTITYWQKGAVYMIVGPRLWQTMQFYAEHGFDLPIKMRRRRKLKVVAADERGA